uniref:Arc family DNA-binding protein n=1 Tax=Saccharothrix espanaensis TaxID=103731 RepID=UPI003F49A88D
MSDDTKSITLRLPADLLSRVDAQAARHRRSRNAELLWLLDQHVADAADHTTRDAADD